MIFLLRQPFLIPSLAIHLIQTGPSRGHEQKKEEVESEEKYA